MGVDFAIDVEPRQPSLAGITDDEVERHYRAQVPAGEPPLAAIREHVIRAIALERDREPDPIDALHTRFVDKFGRYRIWFDDRLEKVATSLGVAPLGSFQRTTDGDLPDEEETVGLDSRRTRILQRGPDRDRWCDPAEGLRTVRALLAEITESDARECLGLVEQMLAIAEREGRRWRLLAMW